MATIKTMRVKLRPCEKTDYGYRMTLGVGREIEGVHNFETEVSTIDEMEAFIDYVLAKTPFAADTALHVNNAWYVSVDPANGRWAPGWKARFDKSRVVAYDEVTA